MTKRWIIACSCCLLWGLGELHAQTFRHKMADGTVVFSDVPMRNGKFERQTYAGGRVTAAKSAGARNPCRGLSAGELVAKGNQLDSLFRTAAREHGVDASLIRAVARAESCFDPRAVSSAGALGLMQLMPGTAVEVGVTDVFDIKQNLRGGTKYLAMMLQRYDNNLTLALAAYNAGPSAVDRHNGVPPFAETQKYVQRVKSFQRRYGGNMNARPGTYGS